MAKSKSNNKLKKPTKNSAVLVGATVAAGVAGVYYLTKNGWPFSNLRKMGSPAPAPTTAGAAKPGGPSSSAPVDVALTNEVAGYAAPNPHNAADFTDDGATGNAD